MSVVLLALDASTSEAGSVAVVLDGEVLAERDVVMRRDADERLLPAVADALAAAGRVLSEVGAVACGAGPGSFTSLRVAASIAKGVALARDLPLFAAPSLLLLVAAARPPLPAGRYIATLNAMRGERFAAPVVVDGGGGIVQLDAGRLAAAHVIEADARAARARLVGPGCEIDARPHARGVARLQLGAPVDLALWEPDYGRAAEAQVRWEAAHGRPLFARE